MATPTMNTMAIVPAIRDARIELTPILLRNVDNFFLVQPGGDSLQQVVSYILQYDGLIDKLAEQIDASIATFDPPKHKQDLAGNLKLIEMALANAIREIAPMHDEATAAVR